jgi:flagellar biosynthesis protein FlhF
VALLTTDSYRIGAYDQLRIYARILGVAVHAVRDANDLAAALGALSARHLVLIDTIGMSQRDRMVAEQAATLAGSDRVKRLLLVQATTNTPTLDQVIAAYRQSHVDGCIVTKADEAASLAPALDSIIRHGLPLHYLTDGQRVPEDLQLPDAAGLVREALQPTRNDVSELTSEEVPLLTQPRLPVKSPDLDEPAALPRVMRPLGRHTRARVVHG